MYPGWSPPLPPGPGPNAHQPAPHEQFQAYLSQIATADHPMLVVAENAAYKGVLAERDQLKEDNRALFYQLEASKETINLLKSLAGSNPSSSSSSGSATPKPSLMTSPSVRPGGCHYFEQSEWLAKKQQLQAAGASSAVLTHGYLAEPDGDPCDAQRRRVFNEHMNTHFTQLYHEGRDPAVWSSATAEVVDYLVDGLLRLDSVFISKGNWKPKEALKYQFAIWCSKNRPKLGPRQSSERLPNAHEILKVQKKALRDAVKAKKGSAPPPGTKVINVDDDAAVPASSGTVQVKKEPGEEEKGDGDKPANARVDELEGEKEKMDEPKGDLKDVEVEEPGGDVSSNDDEERDKPGTPPANASGGLPPTTIPSDPFAGLDIPPPNIDIPHIPASPNTIANMSKKRKADSLDGPWDPPKDRFTGKAFYAIEYKEKNPVATERDFEREWKKVAKDVRAFVSAIFSPDQRDFSLGPKPRQIFVTQSRVLATRVEEYFSKLLESLAAAKKSKEELKEIAEKKKLQKEGDIGLYDVNDDVTWKASLPHKFSLLQDEHFPLFLTFERLCQLLEGDCERAPAHATSDKIQLITYDTFFEQYWPHFPQDLTKNLDPALVFSELLGVIEGSEQSLTHESRYLDLTSYTNLSHRAQHVFAKQRARIYLLFQAYMKYKKQRGEFDTADRTHRVLTAFEKTGIPGVKIDFLYVDEAQDNLLIDAMLLRSLCCNPNGLFWAGDTAQTIAIGSSFRFNDLKAFLYRLEQHREQGGCSVTQSELRTFQLVVNYRSHAGIVRCATAVIELITHFWPYAIDSLAPEEGIVDGAKPVFFSGWDTNTVRYEQFLFGDSGERIEFGARQCILVRDEAAKTELRKQVGDIGLILTLYESKGLEFDDVLLYKFFEDSTVDLGQWRVVLNLLEKPTGQTVSAPRFDEERHAGVCSELKFLYVAITRSRKNLWIVDCSDKAEPMKMLWESKGYIQNCVPGGDVPRLAVSSTPEEWEATGRALFTNRRYLQAMHSFERAGLVREAKISYTHYLRDIARSIQAVNKETRSAKRDAFCSAANSFLECAHDAKGKEQRVFFHNAADCFEKAGSCSDNTGDYGKAARAYEDAKEYTPAVRLYRKTEMFDEAVNVVQNHRQQVDEELAKGVQEIARLFYFKNKQFGKAKMLFDSVEEELEYLEDNILLDDCHAAVLIDLGRYQEAADIHMAEGRTMEAVEALLDDKENVESKQRANDCILQGLWESTSFSQKIKATDAAARKLLQHASKVDKDAMLLTPTQKDELEMFKALRKSDGSTSSFRQLAYRFLGRKEIHQTVLCFDHYFINFPSTLEITNEDMVAILADFGQYCRSFRDLILRLDVGDVNMQKLFNFYPASIGDTYRVKTETWLYRQVTDATARLRILESNDKFVVVSGDELQQLLKTVLWRRLEQRILAENDLCQRIRVFTPCLPFVMNGECRLVNCPRHHIDYQELTQIWFNCQVRIHLLQILIYHVYLGIPTPKDRNQTIQDRRYWIHRLHETLRPAAHYLGSETSVRQGGSKIPEALPGSQTVVKWLRDILGNRVLPFDRMLLTFLYEGASLLMRFDTINAKNSLMRAPLQHVFAGRMFFYRLKETVYVVPELYHSLRAADHSFISAGILFFQHILDKAIQIDVNVLCHLVEFLSGSVIFARVQFNLHNVILPRSWILTLLRQITMRELDTMLVDRLLRSMQALLENLIKGGEGARYLLFEGRIIAELQGLRDLFVHRICRALALIGHNIPNEDLRHDIFQIMKVLPVETTKIHDSFWRFAKARGWGGVIVAAQASCTDSHLDEMVQLCSTEKPVPEWPPPENVRRVFFKSLEDVPLALSTDPLSAEAKPRAEAKPLSTDTSNAEAEPLSTDTSTAGAESLLTNTSKAQAQPLVPDSSNPQANTPDPGAESERQVDHPQIEQPEADVTDVVDSRDLVDSLVNTAAPLDVERSSPEQKDLALRLVHKYRQRIRNRKLEKHKTTTQKTCDSYFETCLKLASDPKEMQWPCGLYYRSLYLGLVPHLLACVKAVESYAFNARAKARMRYRKEEKQDYDGMHKRTNEIGAVLKGCKTLGRQLDPSSEVHKKRDIEGLKQLVHEVEQLVNQVPPGAALDVQFSLQLAIKGIVTEPKPKQPKEALKPELNMEEDYPENDYPEDDYLDDDLAYEMYH